MPTYLDFRCAACGATAPYMSLISGALSCSEHRATEGHPWVVTSGIDRDLYHHELVVVFEDTAAGMASYRLTRPGGSEAQSVRIAFLGGTIVIHGDLAPGRAAHDNRGVISRPGERLGVAWFAGAFSEHYVASKFLDEVWEPGAAAEKCREMAEDVEQNDSYRDALLELAEQAAGIDTKDTEDVLDWCRDLVRLTDEPDDVQGCYSFDRANKALLIAIQRRFAILWRARSASDA